MEERGQLLTEGSFHDTSDNFPNQTEDEFVDANHTSVNSFEMDDEELLTSGLDVEPAETSNNDLIGMNARDNDGDDFSDEDLLAD